MAYIVMELQESLSVPEKILDSLMLQSAPAVHTVSNGHHWQGCQSWTQLDAAMQDTVAQTSVLAEGAASSQRSYRTATVAAVS
jgi:hypothetical protein